MKVVVYTALFGDIDRLWSPCSLVMDGCEHVCFSDRPRRQVGLWAGRGRLQSGTKDMNAPPFWDVRIVPKGKLDGRCAARYYKTCSHICLPDADVTVWVDGNLRLLISPKKAARQWLRGGHLAAFKHPIRKCLYAEARTCMRTPRGREYGKDIVRQVAAYRKQGMPENWGLAETRCVVRVNSEKASKMNEAWWAEIQEYSPRDQISLPYVCWKQGLRWSIIPGRISVFRGLGGISGDFWCIKHRE